MAPKKTPSTSGGKTLTSAELLERLDPDELAGRIGELEKELDALRVLRKAAEIRTHGKKKRKSPVRKKRDAGDQDDEDNGSATKPLPIPHEGETLKEQIFTYLLHAGPTRPSSLAKAIGRSVGSVSGTLHGDNRLERTEDGWRVKYEHRKGA